MKQIPFGNDRKEGKGEERVHFEDDKEWGGGEDEKRVLFKEGKIGEDRVTGSLGVELSG